MFYPPSTNNSQKLRSVKFVVFRLLSLSIFASFVFSSCQKESLSDGLLLENEVGQSGILAKKGQDDEKRAAPNGCQCTYRILSHSAIDGASFRVEVNESNVQPSSNGEFSGFQGSGINWGSTDVNYDDHGFPTFDRENFMPYPNQSIYTLQSHILDVQFNSSLTWSAELEIHCEGFLYNGGIASNTFTHTITRPSGIPPGGWWEERINCVGCRSIIQGECDRQPG